MSTCPKPGIWRRRRRRHHCLRIRINRMGPYRCRVVQVGPRTRELELSDSLPSASLGREHRDRRGRGPKARTVNPGTLHTQGHLPSHPTKITPPPQLGSAAPRASRRSGLARRRRPRGAEDGGALDRPRTSARPSIESSARRRVRAVAVREHGDGQRVDGRPAEEPRRQHSAPQASARVGLSSAA